MKLLDKIITEFLAYYKEQKNIVDIEATVATEIDEKSLSKQLSKQLNSDIDLNIKVDPKIVAGLILKIGDTLFDGSVNNQLNLLNNQLSNH